MKSIQIGESSKQMSNTSQLAVLPQIIDGWEESTLLIYCDTFAVDYKRALEVLVWYQHRTYSNKKFRGVKCKSKIRHLPAYFGAPVTHFQTSAQTT